MKHTVLLGALVGALLAPIGIAHAHGGVSVSVSTPDFGFRIGAPFYRPAPVVVAAPVYAPVPVYAPGPVYAPAPYYVSPPVYVPAPRVVYRPPVVVQRVVVPRRVVVAPYRSGARVAPWGHESHWKHRYDDRRDYRHDGRRTGYGF